MSEIVINVQNRIASPDTDDYIVCDNSDIQVTFNLDSEWASVDKTLTLKYYDFNRKGFIHAFVPFEGTSCLLPVIHHAVECLIGVTSDTITARPARFVCRRSITGLGGKEGTIPVDVFNQIMADVNGIVPIEPLTPIVTIDEREITTVDGRVLIYKL